MTTLIRHCTNSAASDLGLHCFPIPKVPNLNANSGDPDYSAFWSESTPIANVHKMPLDRTILNLGGVSFVLFEVSLQNKILHCKWTVTESDQGLHCLPKSKKMPLDRSIGQNHLKVMGCQVCFICCKLTKVPVHWQTVLTLNRWAVLRLSYLDLHCWDGLAHFHKKKLYDPN